MKGIILISLLLLSSGVAVAQSTQTPALVLRDINGRSVKLSDFKGKVVLLNFWATWCPPCRAEVPELIAWQKKYRRRGLQVIGVTYPPSNRAEIRRFMRSQKINYPILLGTKEARSLFYKGETLPITVVIDRDQNIRETVEGILLPEEFETKVKPLLGEAEPTTPRKIFR